MPSPEEVTATAREYLADHPAAEDSLRALIEHDAHTDVWTFDDTNLDSGQFGELVARDLATRVDGGYQLQHPTAITNALESDASDVDPTTAKQGGTTVSPGQTTPSESSMLSRLAARTSLNSWGMLGLLGTLFAVVAARLVAAPNVLYDGFVVSPANDTYFFRYWQERLAARASGPFDVGVFAEMGGAASTRPLAHAINWWVTVLLGGVDAASAVAAWLPIAAAVALGYVVYRLTVVLTGDVRVALASVLFYALAPVNVVYTSIGFLDHQAHQYLWLGILVFAMTALAADVKRRTRETAPAVAAAAHARDRGSWILAGLLAVAVAASVHLWGGSPLTFVPVAAVIGLRVALDVRHDGAPALAATPTLAGLLVGALLAIGAHVQLGWHESIAAATPALVVGGALVVVTLGEIWRAADLSAMGLVIVEGLVAVGGFFAYSVVRPGDVARFRTRAGDLFFREGATETVSLFSPDFAVVFGPLLQLGLGFYLAIGVLAAVTWTLVKRYEPGWLVLVTFGWYYILLATIQVRFAGQLAIIIAPLAGVGLVYLLAAIDIARPVSLFGRANDNERDGTQQSLLDNLGGDHDNASSDGSAVVMPQLPDGTQVRGYLVLAVALVLLFNLLLVPPLVGQTTYDRAQFDAATTIDAHAESVDREYPQNFVLSQWGDNRMYNYFVNGESQSYGYAQSNYEPFITAGNPDSSYDRFQERVGYVVITEREGLPSVNSTYAQLYEGYGVGANGTTATGHYQLLAADSGVRTFAVVPGARLHVSGHGEKRVTATTSVAVSGKMVQYTRDVPVSEDVAVVRVAHPGDYAVGNRTVTVSEEAVLTGAEVSVSE